MLALPRRVWKGIRIGYRRVRSPRLGYTFEIEKTQIILNNPRSSIKKESAPDPIRNARLNLSNWGNPYFALKKNKIREEIIPFLTLQGPILILSHCTVENYKTLRNTISH